MSAELIVRSEIPPLSWQEFIDTHPVGSIAIDGYVSDGPMFDLNGPYKNANHHEGVSRLDTLSTAQQIHRGILMGMDKAFTFDGEFSPKVYANDCDQDVCATWFLLNHVEQAKVSTNPMLKRFIEVAGTLDATAGAYPYDKALKILGELAWVFEPYTMFRASGEWAKKDNDQYRSVIQSVEARIQQHLMGRGESVKLDLGYKLIGGGQDWKMIEEIGKDGRVGALLDGIDAYVSVQELPVGGKWRYTVGKRSEYIPFDVTKILERLNSIEECDKDRWGGANIIGGSPRVGGSKLSPAEVEKVINELIAEQ